MRVGDRKVLENGWSITVDEDPYGREDLVAVTVRWDEKSDDLPELVYQQTVGLNPYSAISHQFLSNIIGEIEKLADSITDTETRIRRFLNKQEDDRREAREKRRRFYKRQAARAEIQRREAERKRQAYRRAINPVIVIG